MLECLRCRHKWMPNTEQMPKACPKCKTKRWQTKEIVIECQFCGYAWGMKGRFRPYRCCKCKKKMG